MIKKVIAVDGPAGAGKSTVSKMVAEKLGYTYIDTGAMYRAIAYKLINQGGFITREVIASVTKDIDIDLRYAKGATKVIVDGKDVSEAIRTPEVSHVVPEVAKIEYVRERLTELQRKMAARGGVIMDGRDIGTKVLPNADVKIFLTASIDERARRRFEELKAKGYDANLKDIKNKIALRDKQDTERKISPLEKADDAVLVDSTDKTINEVVDEILSLCK